MAHLFECRLPVSRYLKMVSGHFTSFSENDARNGLEKQSRTILSRSGHTYCFVNLSLHNIQTVSEETRGDDFFSFVPGGSGVVHPMIRVASAMWILSWDGQIGRVFIMKESKVSWSGL